MFIADLFEATSKKTLVILPGGFHPFHPGHFSLYQSAQQAFPKADIYYASTNDKNQRPFDFSDKARLAEIAGVPAGHFVQVKSPFQAKEIVDQYDANNTVLIFARSEKDRAEPPRAGGVKKNGEPSYLQPIGKTLKPLSQHGYMAYLPTVEFTGGITSASEIRNQWPGATPQQRRAWAKELYPADPVAAQHILDKYLAVQEDASGVIASKSQARDPRYSMSLTQDVRPGAINKNLRAFDLAENNPVTDTTVYLIKKYRDDIDYYQDLIADGNIDSAVKPYYQKKIAELKRKIQQLWQGSHQ
jgi:hypothetical protein